VSEKQYRTVMGIVQFEPREGEAAGKPIRSVTIRNIGFKEQAVRVYLTVWPSHADVEIKEGDVVLAEGAYTRGSGEKDGKSITYHNISVNRLAVLGAINAGKRVETVNDDDDAGDDDDIPF
jgi:hypothetical protein